MSFTSRGTFCDEGPQDLLQVGLRTESISIIDLVSLFECYEFIAHTAFISVYISLIKLRNAILKQFGRCALARTFARPGVNRAAGKGWQW